MKMKISRILITLGLFASTYSLFAGYGAAMDIGELSENIVSTMSGVVKLITAVSYVAGMGFALAGIIKFKSHRDNPTNVPLSQPITMLVIGTCLLFLPNILQSAGVTVFGGNSQSGSTHGFTSLDGTIGS